MPKSKRNKLVSLTKAKKKGKEWKEGLVSTVRTCLDSYKAVYLVKYYNMRTERFKALREEVQDSSRFILGSNKIMQVALGRTDADEYKVNLHLLAERLKGDVGLFCTNLDHEQVLELFDQFHHDDYARAGARATQDFSLPEGPMEGPRGPLPHMMEPQLRKLGLPTKLNKGVVELLAPQTVCTTGQRLDANQAALLRIFDVKMADFHFKPVACWRVEGEQFEELDDGEDSEDGGAEDFGEEELGFDAEDAEEDGL